MTNASMWPCIKVPANFIAQDISVFWFLSNKPEPEIKGDEIVLLKDIPKNSYIIIDSIVDREKGKAYLLCAVYHGSINADTELIDKALVELVWDNKNDFVTWMELNLNQYNLQEEVNGHQ